jgi:hypothetical protein
VKVPKFAEAKVPPQIEGEQPRMLEKVLDESLCGAFGLQCSLRPVSRWRARCALP